MNAESKSKTSHRTEIIVAVITLVGVLGGALFANWDKVFPPSNPVLPPSTQPPTPSTPSNNNLPGAFVEKFVGRWINENSDTSGITRVNIDSRLNKVIVHMWGKCHPSDCDWGTVSTSRADSDDKVLSIKWSKSFAVTDQKISILSDGRLRVTGHTRFTDNSGRPDYDSVYYFIKQ
jgi:hypothetical protein